MSCLYVVRCNFNRPELADQWNAWYNGPKTAEMLSKPYFRSSQRFRATGLDQTLEYLALWVLDSPAAFHTPEYRSNWGFFEWAPMIIDWSRNLYAAPDDEPPLIGRLAVSPGESICVAALDGVVAAEAERRLPALAAARPDALWLRSIGLDGSCPLLGLQRLPAGEPALEPLPAGLAAGVRESIYTPISAFSLSD